MRFQITDNGPVMTRDGPILDLLRAIYQCIWRKLEQCPVLAPSYRERRCIIRDSAGNLRLEVTTQLRLRKYQSFKA